MYHREERWSRGNGAKWFETFRVGGKTAKDEERPTFPLSRKDSPVPPPFKEELTFSSRFCEKGDFGCGGTKSFVSPAQRGNLLNRS